MKLDIVIPTRKRLGKLAVCLRSIERAIRYWHAECYVYFDTEREGMEFGWEYPELNKWVHVGEIVGYTAPKLWNQHLKHMTSDGMMYLNDDVEMLDDGVEVARNQFVLHYPDYDGVLGFQQENLRGKFDTAPAAFGIVGRKFADRFPDRQVFCPDYHHLWIDREVEKAARYWGKFHQSTQVKLNHFHPCVDVAYADDTHTWIRRWKDADRVIHEKRERMGWTWGIDFNLVGTGEEI